MPVKPPRAAIIISSSSGSNLATLPAGTFRLTWVLTGSTASLDTGPTFLG
jgi:hypothetical protein